MSEECSYEIRKIYSIKDFTPEQWFPTRGGRLGAMNIERSKNENNVIFIIHWTSSRYVRTRHTPLRSTVVTHHWLVPSQHSCSYKYIVFSLHQPSSRFFHYQFLCPPFLFLCFSLKVWLSGKNHFQAKRLRVSLNGNLSTT